MTYLTRPVYDLPINWAASPAKSFSYDLASVTLAQAAPRIQATQQHVVRGWDVALLLETEERIVAHDDFTAARLGRLNGFWFPSPASHGRVATKIDNNTFDVPNIGLAGIWTYDPCLHVVFQPRSGAWYCGKIVSVEDRLDGTERITLEADASRTLNEGDVFRRLLYVRLASDTENAEYIADHAQTRQLRLVELPLEYAQVETGQRPIYLYELSTTDHSGAAVYTRWTGFDVNVSSNLGGGTSYTFTSFPVRHRDVRQSLRGGPDDLTLETVIDAANPISDYVSATGPTRPLFLRIWSTQYGATNTVTAIFAGEVGETSAEGIALTSKCSLVWSRRGRKFPRVAIQDACNWGLYTAPCGMVKNSWKATGVVTSVHYDRVTVTVSDPPISGKPESANANFYALGWVEWSTPKVDLRGVVSSSQRSSGRITLVLDEPVTDDLVGVTLSFYAGCDLTIATCHSKFANKVRHGGFPYVPAQNPTVRAMETEIANGNKK